MALLFKSALTVCLGISICGIALGQEESSEAQHSDQPTADEIVQKHIDALGGEMLLLSVESIRVAGHINVLQGGIGWESVEFLWKEQGWTTTYSKTGTDLTIGQCDGRIWKRTNIADPVWASEVETATYKYVNRSPTTVLEWRDFDGKISVEGIQQIDDKDAWQLNFEYADGASIKRWFDVETGLQVQTGFQISGTVAISRASDFRTVQGIQYAFKETSTYPERDIEIEMIVDGFEVNADFDDTRIELPKTLREDPPESKADKR